MSYSRFKVVERLGEGGMGVVFSARDLHRGVLVALKSLEQLDAPGLQQFKQEFRFIANLSHPNLAALYELICENDSWYFTMELVNGVDFFDFVWDGPSADKGYSDSVLNMRLDDSPQMEARIARLEHLLPQLIDGVMYLHSNGIIHRDLKPSNVLISTSGRVVILDFGLALSEEHMPSKTTLQGTVSGTLEYLAPEGFGGSQPTPALDTYAIGAMVYEALTGRLPFEGDIREILAAKLTSPPPPPVEFAPDVPEEWSDFCLELLARAPEKRPAIQELAKRFPLDKERMRRYTPGAHFDPIFVGREQELEVLKDGFARLEQSLSTNIFVQGRSGVGKSVLVKRFIDEISRSEDVTILTGRCYQQEFVPFKAFDSLVDTLTRTLSKRSDAAELVPEDVSSLLAVFPVLAKIQPFNDAARFAPSVQDRQEQSRRGVAALREVLLRLASRTRLVVYIDNLQWGDSDSAEVLHSLLRWRSEFGMLFIGSSRSENKDSSPLFVKLQELETLVGAIPNRVDVEIEPLREEQSLALARSLLGSDAADVQEYARVAAEESGGNPYFLMEFIRYLLSEQDRAECPAPGLRIQLLDVLWRRISLLDEDARRLLITVAVGGHPLPSTLAYHAAGFESEDPAIVVRLRAETLIKTIGEGDKTALETYHDKVREAVLANVSESDVRELHASLAVALIRNAPAAAAVEQHAADIIAGDISRLPAEWTASDMQTFAHAAFHLHSAGDVSGAFSWAVIAAHHASSVHSLETAKRLLEIAEPHACRIGVEAEHYLSLQLSKVLLLLGEFDRTERLLQTTLATARSEMQKAEVEHEFGELAFRRGINDQAIYHQRRAIELLGGSMPATQAGWYFLLLRAGFVQLLRSVFVGIRKDDTGKEPSEKEKRMVLYIDRLSHTNYYGDVLGSVAGHFKSMNLVERFKPDVLLASIYTSHGPICAVLGFRARALRYTDRALEICRSRNTVFGLGMAHTYRAIVHFRFSEFESAIEDADRALEYLEKSGDPWAVHIALYQTGASHYLRGDFEEAESIGWRLYELARGVGEVTATCFALDVLAKARFGDVPMPLIDEQYRCDVQAPQGACHIRQALGLRLLRDGALDEAADSFEEGWRKASITAGMNPFCTPAAAWLLTALRMKAEQCQKDDPKEFKRVMRRAKKALKLADRLSRKFTNDRPHVLRERGLLEALSGRTRKAERALRESVAAAEQLGTRYQKVLGELLLKKLTEGAEPDAENGAGVSEWDFSRDPFCGLPTSGSAATQPVKAAPAKHYTETRRESDDPPPAVPQH